MRYIKKPVAYMAWALAFVLSVALAWEFHGGQNKIAIGLALLALILSACSLLFARDAWRQKAWPEFVFGIILWAAGAGFFTITELGYWDSSAAEHHAKYQQVKKAKERQAGLTDQKWNALTTGEIPTSPAQIQAKINAAHMNERWTTTKGCTVVTAAPSRDFCKGVFNLEGDLAQAQQRLDFEKEFAVVGAEQETKLVHNLLAGAEVLNRRLKIEDEKLAADIVIFAAWILLLLARDFGALVADPLGRREKLQEPREVIPATATAITVVAPPAPAPRAEMETLPPIQVSGGNEPWASEAELQKLRDLVAEMRAANLPEIPVSSIVANIEPAPNVANIQPEPDGPGTPVAKPEPAEEVAEAKTTNDGKVVYAQFGEDSTSPLAPRSKKKPQRGEGKAEAWLAAVTTQTDSPKDTVSSGDCWKSYLAYCHAENKHPIHRRAFSRQIGVLLRREAGRGGKRDRHGSVFTGLKLNPTIAQRRRVAA